MKNHMVGHVDSRRSEMFRESCNQVKERLEHMCRQVEEAMANKADEVFINMSRWVFSLFTGAVKYAIIL